MATILKCWTGNSEHCQFAVFSTTNITLRSMMKKDIALPLPDNYLDILMGEFYHKPLFALETEFTNYIMHYKYKNQYLKDPAIRQELEDYYMKWKDKAEHPEVSTNKTEK